MKSLLVATDLSERSDRALARAIMLAATHEARLFVLHVVDDRARDTMVDRQRQAAEEELKCRIRSLPLAAGEDIVVRILVGDPYAEILTEAETSGAELLILGIHRKQPIREFFHGTTIERIIRGGHKPVLIVTRWANDEYRRITVAMDFSECARVALRTALRLAPHGAFHLVHAFDVPFGRFLESADTLSELRCNEGERMRAAIAEETAASSGVKVLAPIEGLVRRGPILDVLHGEVERLNADLLAIGTHGGAGIRRFTIGSVADAILADPPCDVLVARATESNQ